MRIQHKVEGDDVGVCIALMAVISIVLGSLAAWGTHIFWVIKTLASPAGITVGQAILGVIGTFVPPVGVVHGIMIWMGAA